MRKLYKDPITGRFVKRPANQSASSSSNVASSSARPALVFPTPCSHPIPGSFDSLHSPVPSLDASDTDDTAHQGTRSFDRQISLPAFVDAVQRARSLTPSPPPPESQDLSDSFDDTETLVPYSRLVIDSLTQIDTSDDQEPSPTFTHARPSSGSPPSYSTSLVSSAYTSLPSSLLPSSSSSSPAPAPPVHRHPSPPQLANPCIPAPPPQNQPPMANQANGLAGMPGPRSANAPSFSKEKSASFADFLHEYEALTTANTLSNP